MFKKASGEETLHNDGFQVFKEQGIKNIIEMFPRDLEDIASKCNSKDVFRTKLGDIKQIQNLDFHMLNRKLARLIGAEEFDVLNNQYFCKPPNYKMTSAHQDNAYFESYDNVFTFWIPLQDVNIYNSCMFYVPKSHLNGLVEHKAIGTNVRTRTGKTGVSLYSDFYKNEEFVQVDMGMGDILVHDKNTMHFSSANITDNYRLAITSIIRVKSYGLDLS